MATIDELNALVTQIDADANAIQTKEQGYLDQITALNAEIAALQAQLAAAITPAQSDALKTALTTLQAKVAALK